MGPNSMRTIFSRFRQFDVGPHVRAALWVAFSVGVLLCLADGILDISLSAKQSLWLWQRNLSADARSPGTMIAGVVPARTYDLFRDVKFSDPLPSVGRVPLATHKPGLHIGPDGERMTPPARGVKRTGVLLGASQAFGWYIADDETLAASLQRDLPGVAFRNYAVPGQTVRENILRWRQLRRAGARFQFALLVAGPFDLVNMDGDFGQQTQAGSGIALARVYTELKRHIAPAPTQPAPANDIDARVDALLYDFQSALAFAHRVHVPLAIAIPPVPYGNRSDEANLRHDRRVQELSPVVSPLVRALRRRLKERPIPGIYDLSDVFDGKPAYFIDASGHINSAGQTVLAHAIVARIGPDFFLHATDGAAATAPGAQKSK